MTGLLYVEVAIGLIFTVLVYSLAASVIQEVVATALSWRSAALREGIRGLVGETFEAFWNRPLIESLKRRPFGVFRPIAVNAKPPAAKPLKDPSYISGAIFAKALLEMEGLAGLTPAEIRHRLNPLLAAAEPTALVQRINAVVAAAGDTAAEAEQAIAAWYDQSMERVSGWYVRRVKLTLFVIGFAMAAATNTNLFAEAQDLLANDAKRARLVALAEKATTGELADTLAILDLPQNELAGVAPDELAKAYRALRTFSAELEAVLARTEAPRGWSGCDDRPCGFGTLWDGAASLVAFVLLGLLVTLGAQFWFDLLKLLVSIRAAGKSKTGEAPA